ncbi:carboxylesterase family protein [Paracoccus aerodenitrificans]|uniref:carboxylesterase family protein n=1 Tax=Paracoccus aerodenitrificans TaxID=3017781 RepID=UPI0022F0E1AD|nr:carboxylesterase family protein [Paracoccus aerodenitrificans]WBU63007.1 carboxylesterase family protein [Paracoccus aerodenitrificans]
MKDDAKTAPGFAERRTRMGQIRCRLQGGLLKATGIPYAQAGRWEYPREVAAAPVNATSWSPACPQLPIARLDAALPTAFDRLGFDENCLNLSVTAPEQAEGLPVMVWMHGGSYEAGAGDMAVFDPSALVSEQRVVVVSVTYRLGLLGWLSGAGRPANLGAFDVIAALRWVSRNIAAFGGDPGRVVLFGQSSGGDLAARLMLTEHAGRLFQAAIIQSAPLNLPLRSRRMRNAMRRAAGILTSGMPISEILARQHAVRKAAQRYGLSGLMPFGPEFGEAPFPAESDLRQAWDRIAQDLPIMIGHTQDEAGLFMPPSSDLAGRMLDPVRRVAVRSLTSHIYGRPARNFARRYRQAGGKATSFLTEWGPGAFGRAHLSELPLLFPALDWIGTPLLPPGMSLDELTRIGAPLRKLWADFARGENVGSDLPGVIRFLPQG